MKTLQSAPWKFRCQPGLCCCPRNKNFLDNHLPRVPITPNQQGTIEMREEVLSSVGAQDTNTRRCELSDLEDIEFR